MRRSHASARFIPAPAAGPLTAASTGLVISAMASTASFPARKRPSSSWPASRVRASRSRARSPPAQNARPAPVSTTQRTPVSAPARRSASTRAAANSTFNAFSRSGRLSVRATTSPSRASSTSAPGAGCAALANALLARRLLLQTPEHSREQAEIPQLRPAADSVLPAGRRQHKHLRAIQALLLQAELAPALGKLLKRQLAVERDDARRELLQLPRQQDTPFGEFLPMDLLHAARGALDQVGQADAELDDAFV